MRLSVRRDLEKGCRPRGVRVIKCVAAPRLADIYHLTGGLTPTAKTNNAAARLVDGNFERLSHHTFRFGPTTQTPVGLRFISDSIQHSAYPPQFAQSGANRGPRIDGSNRRSLRSA
jgi:hypothetical protein